MKILALCLIALAGCAHTAVAPNGPEQVARAYAQALREGRVDDAFALSAPLTREQFGQRYADAAARVARADVLEQAASGTPTAPVALEVREQGWRVVEATEAAPALADDSAARALVLHFLGAVDAGDFEAVFGDLSAAWRARYTPARLKADLAQEPAAVARLQRIRAALAGKWELTLSGPQLPLGDGRALKLLREGAALKVAALE